MKVEITDMPALRVAAVRHVGSYQSISDAFMKLSKIADVANLRGPNALLLAIYYDDPRTTPKAELQSDAGISVDAGATIPDGLTEQGVPAGRYATTRHHGPYAALPDTWAQLTQEWLTGSEHKRAAGPSYEVYRNDPSNTAPVDLITDLYIPVT